MDNSETLPMENGEFEESFEKASGHGDVVLVDSPSEIAEEPMFG